MKNNKQITPSILVIVAFVTVIASSLLAYFVSTAVVNADKQSHTSSETKMQGKLIVHISSGVDDPHSQMMGLQKALKAKEAGSDVFLFMDVSATDLALKTTNITFADFAPSQKLIAELIEKGVEVYVCPHCLMVNGDKMSDVQTGIKELTMDAMMKFGQGSGVTTLDY